MDEEERDRYIKDMIKLRIDKKELSKCLKEIKQCKNKFQIPRLLANLVSVYDKRLDIEYSEFKTLENIFYDNRIKERIPKVLSAYDQIKKRKHTEKKPYRYNDLDYKAFYIPRKKRKILCIEDQNVNYIYIVEKGINFDMKNVTLTSQDGIHIRRYFSLDWLKEVNFDFNEENSKSKWYNYTGPENEYPKKVCSVGFADLVKTQKDGTHVRYAFDNITNLLLNLEHDD